MRIKSKSIALAVLCTFIIIFAALACAGGKDASPDQREPTGTVGAESDSGADDAGDFLKMPNTGILDSPIMPFHIDTPYIYELTHSGEPTCRTEISVTMVGETDFKVVGNQSFYGPGSSEKIAEVVTAYALDSKLRPKMYIQRLSGADGLPREIKSIDFTSDMLTLETTHDPLEEDSTIIEIERPDADIWPFDLENILSVAMIFACIDPAVEEIGVWVLEVNGGRLGRFTLVSKGDEPIILDDDLTTLMVRKYEGSLDGLLLGTYFVSPDRRLIAMDQPGGLHAELKMLSEEVLTGE